MRWGLWTKAVSAPPLLGESLRGIELYVAPAAPISCNSDARCEPQLPNGCLYFPREGIQRIDSIWRIHVDGSVHVGFRFPSAFTFEGVADGPACQLRGHGSSRRSGGGGRRRRCGWGICSRRRHWAELGVPRVICGPEQAFERVPDLLDPMFHGLSRLRPTDRRRRRT